MAGDQPSLCWGNDALDLVLYRSLEPPEDLQHTASDDIATVMSSTWMLSRSVLRLWKSFMNPSTASSRANLAHVQAPGQPGTTPLVGWIGLVAMPFTVATRGHLYDASVVAANCHGI